MSLDPTENVSSDRRGINIPSSSAVLQPGGVPAPKPLIYIFDYCSSSMKNLYTMQQEGLLCDVSFIIPGDGRSRADEIIPAHRAVLASSSVYFRALFTSGMADATSPTITMHGVRSAATFRLLIEFIYTGRIINPLLALGDSDGLAAVGGAGASTPERASSPTGGMTSGGTTGGLSSPPPLTSTAESLQKKQQHVEEMADSILCLLELADLYAMELLFNHCSMLLKQRVCLANCVPWMRFTSRLPNSNELYQCCLAYFCSHLHEFPPQVVVPFDSTLFLSVVSSECLRVDNEMQVFELTALWLMALDSELDLQDGIGTGPASISADLLDLASAVPTSSRPTRIAIHGASLLQHIRFAKIPLARLNEWFERRHMYGLREAIGGVVVNEEVDEGDDDADDSAEINNLSKSLDVMMTLHTDSNTTTISNKHRIISPLDTTTSLSRAQPSPASQELYTVCCQALLEQLAKPKLQSELTSTSGWSNTRFYPVSLYDRQSATVFKQAHDEGLVRAIVMSPDCRLMFTGSATTSSSELVLSQPVYPTTIPGPEAVLKIWRTTSNSDINALSANMSSSAGNSATSTASGCEWVCEQSTACVEDIVALVIQEYPPDVYLAMQKQYDEIVIRMCGGMSSEEAIADLGNEMQAILAAAQNVNLRAMHQMVASIAPAAVAAPVPVAPASVVPVPVAVVPPPVVAPVVAAVPERPSSVISPFASLYQSVRAILGSSSSATTTISTPAVSSVAVLPSVAAPVIAAAPVVPAVVAPAAPVALITPPVAIPAGDLFANAVTATAAAVIFTVPPPTASSAASSAGSEKSGFASLPSYMQACPVLPNYQLISAQLGRQSHHHTPKLRLRSWQYHPLQGLWKSIWNTRSWIKEQEWSMDATLRSFVVCSCGVELIGRQLLRAMPAKLGGNHKAKLASCLAIHRNCMIFPMHDCIVSCDPHTGARLQRFMLPPAVAPSPEAQLAQNLSLGASGSQVSWFHLSSPSVIPQAALVDPEAWTMSSFVLVGDLLFVATYHGWLGIFSVSYESSETQRETVMRLQCERYWQTAGASVEKGAVVNQIAVISRQEASTSGVGSAERLSDEIEDAVAGVMTVLDYGSSLAFWRKY